MCGRLHFVHNVIFGGLYFAGNLPSWRWMVCWLWPWTQQGNEGRALDFFWRGGGGGCWDPFWKVFLCKFSQLALIHMLTSSNTRSTTGLSCRLRVPLWSWLYFVSRTETASPLDNGRCHVEPVCMLLAIIGTIHRQIFLYACKSWTLKAELQRRIQAMEMRCYTRLRISYKDDFTNEEVYAKIQ